MLTKINGWIAECDWCGKKNSYTVYDKPFSRIEEIYNLVELGWYVDDNKNELVCPACQKKARRNLEAILNIAYPSGHIEQEDLSRTHNNEYRWKILP